MKNTIIFSGLLYLLITGACKCKDHCGDITFYNAQSGIDKITVNVHGKDQDITSNGVPSGCGESGFASFNLAEDEYKVTFKTEGYDDRTYEVKVYEDSCVIYRITY
jgi:hypothetical protein